MKPLLIVMSAPSGTGKTTLCDLLLQEFPEITYSISCTTRAPRGMEEDGIDYFFLSKEAFQQRVAEGQLLEHAIVHGNYYVPLKVSSFPIGKVIGIALVFNLVFIISIAWKKFAPLISILLI